MFIRALVYFVPIAINFINGGIFFISALRFAQAECSGVVTGSAFALWGIVYCGLSLLVGRKVTQENTLRFIFSGGGVLAVTVIMLSICGVYEQFIWLCTGGAGSALFCTPFQLFAKSLETGGKKSGGLRQAVGFYTFSWSFGFASGSLAFSCFSIRAGYNICLALALTVLACVGLIALFRPKNNNIVQEEESVAAAVSPEVEARFSKLALMGWIIGGIGTVAVCQVRAMWPKLGEELMLPRSHIALVLATVSYAQAFVGLLLCCSKTWLYRKLPIIGFALVGIAGMMILVYGQDLWLFYIAAVLYGLYSGSCYFTLTHHSLAHPVRSGYYVSGNEAVVGTICMIAPVVGGLLVDCFHFTGAAFIFSALTALAGMIYQVLFLQRFNKEA
jgi:MFS family permease